MAKTYAIGVVPATTTTPYVALGSKTGGHERTYLSNFTLAAQAIADEIVVLRPNPGEIFLSAKINLSVTLATSTVQLKQYDVTGTFVRNLTSALAFTVAYIWTEHPALNLAIGSRLDGGEIRLSIAALALPAAGNVWYDVVTTGY